MPSPAAPAAKQPGLPSHPADGHALVGLSCPLSSPQVSDAVLTAAFQKFPSFQKAKVVRHSHNGAHAPLARDCHPNPFGRLRACPRPGLSVRAHLAPLCPLPSAHPAAQASLRATALCRTATSARALRCSRRCRANTWVSVDERVRVHGGGWGGVGGVVMGAAACRFMRAHQC